VFVTMMLGVKFNFKRWLSAGCYDLRKHTTHSRCNIPVR